MGSNRATVSLPNLVELNDSVTVECNTAPLNEAFVKQFDVRNLLLKQILSLTLKNVLSKQFFSLIHVDSRSSF